MRCLYFQRLFYVFLCSSAKMAFVGFRWALQRLPPCAADCDSYSPARFRPSACRPHSASGRLDELSDFAVGLRCAAAADGDAAAHGRARAVPSDVGFAAAHAAPFVRHEGDEGLAREVVCCEEGRDGRCDGRPPAGRTDVDHVVSPGVGQVGFQRRTVVRADLAPGLIDDGAVLRGVGLLRDDFEEIGTRGRSDPSATARVLPLWEK